MKMGRISKPSADANVFHNRQKCIKSVFDANLPPNFKKEIKSYIFRNLSYENTIGPCCLKAHIVVTAKRLGYTEKRIFMLKKLFKSRIGHNGFYLDAGKLRTI